MAGPPKDIPASELFLKMMEVPRPSEVIDSPRRDENGDPVGKLRVRVLTMREHDEARVRAHARVKKLGLTAEDMSGELIKEVLGDATAKELIALACYTAEPAKGTESDTEPLYGRLFRSADDVEKLTANEVSYLFNEYLLVQHRYGPFEKTVEGPEDLSSWIKRLKEGASHYPLLQLSWPALAELAWLLAERAYLLSATLESLWETLPDSSKSDLQSCSLDTGYFGMHARKSTPAGSENSDEGTSFEDAIAEIRKLRDE